MPDLVEPSNELLAMQLGASRSELNRKILLAVQFVLLKILYPKALLYRNLVPDIVDYTNELLVRQ